MARHTGERRGTYRFFSFGITQPEAAKTTEAAVTPDVAAPPADHHGLRQYLAFTLQIKLVTERSSLGT